MSADFHFNSEFNRIEDIENIIDRYGYSYVYEFDIKLPNGKTAGKVGDTNAPRRREAEWAKAYKGYFPVHFDYVGTTDIDKDTFFRDYSVHAYGKQCLDWKQAPRDDFPVDAHYTQEAYYGANADNTAEAVLQLRDGIRAGQLTAQLYHRKNEEEYVDAPSEPYVPRANQQICIDNIISAYNSGRHHLLCAAHPRFGKSFTALYAIDKLGKIDFVMVVSAVADAHDEWKDTVNLPNFRNKWIFLDSKDLAGGTGHDIADKINGGKKVVVFCTLQDIEGDEKKAKHAEIYKFAKRNSFLIVDETHNGGRGITFSKKIKQIDSIDDDDAIEKEDIDKANEAAVNFGFVNQLHLSGTPYRILLTDEFAPEDIVYMASYSDLLAEKHTWGIAHPDDDERKNPYYEFPERYNFVYDLNQIPDDGLKQFIDEEGIPRLAELFAVVPGEDKFVNEGVVRSFIKALWGNFSDNGCWGILSDNVLNAAVKKFHILMKLPSIAACDAFAELISACDEFKDYAVILATSNRQKNPTVKAIKQQVKTADESDKTAGTITLTCQRLSAAVSVKQWNVAINASDGKSAQDYDQFAQRVCTPFAVDFANDSGDEIKQCMKPSVFVIDLVPERVMSVSMQAAVAKCAARGVSSPSDFRTELEKVASNTMTFLVSGIDSMKQVTAVDVMDMSANYAKTSTIDIAVAKVPFCASLFDGDVAEVMDSLAGISSATSFDTKTYEGADDADVSDKRKKPENGDDENTESPVSPLADTKDGANDDSDDDSKKRREQMAKQRAFFARLGYLSVLSDSQLDSVDSLLDECDGTEDGRKKLVNVIGLSMDDCRAIAAAVKSNPVARIAADNLVYNLTRRMNDENMTDEEKLAVFAAAFSKLGDAEVVTPAVVAGLMCSDLSDDSLYGVIGSGSRVIDFSSETGEFSLALLRRFDELGVFASEAGNSICAIPASPLAYECTRKAYELLGLDMDNIYRFTAYDLLNAIKSDNGGIDESVVARVSDILKQAKKPCDISLDDVVKEGAGKVEIAAIVGNPPYQSATSKSDTQTQGNSVWIYPMFQIFSDTVANESCLIYPFGGWFDSPTRLGGFGNRILHDGHTVSIAAYEGTTDKRAWYRTDRDAQPIFGSDANLSAGVSIVHRSAVKQQSFTFYNRVYSDTTVTVDYSDSAELCQNPDFYSIKKKLGKNTISSVSRPNAFGIESNFVENNPDKVAADPSPFDNPVHIFTNDKSGSSGRSKWFYTDKKNISKGSDILDNYKVICPSAYPKKTFVSGRPTGRNVHRRLGELIGIIEPNEACGRSRLVMFSSPDKVECENFVKYTDTMFFANLVLQEPNKSSSFGFVIPMQDFSSNSDIDWSASIEDIDEQLFKKYNLSDKDMEFLER